MLKGEQHIVPPMSELEWQHLSPLMGQLVDLRNSEECDDYGILRATKYAFDLACNLLVDAAIVAAKDGRQIPHGCASTDSEGSIRIEWVRPTTSVHLVVPATGDSEEYIYHEIENQYGTETASAEVLAFWLRVID